MLSFSPSESAHAEVVELADALDSGSSEAHASWGFKSPLRHSVREPLRIKNPGRFSFTPCGRSPGGVVGCSERIRQDWNLRLREPSPVGLPLQHELSRAKQQVQVRAFEEVQP